MNIGIDSTAASIDTIDLSKLTGLHTKALIASISIGCWSGRKYDAKASDETAKAFNANTDAGRFNKLLVDKNEINFLISLGTQARRYHELMTLPWGAKGSRILPTKAYTEFVNGINKKIQQFWAGVDQFVARYPMLREQRRAELAEMYVDADYPSVEELRKKYFFEVDFTLLPDPQSDIRLSLNDIEIDKVRASMKDTIKRVEEDAVKELWRRMKKVVARIVDRLGDPEATFKNSTFEKIDDLEKIVDMLNVTENADLSQTMGQIKDKLREHDPDDLRDDKKLRRNVAKEAKSILDKIDSMI